MGGRWKVFKLLGKPVPRRCCGAELSCNSGVHCEKGGRRDPQGSLARGVDGEGEGEGLTGGREELDVHLLRLDDGEVHRRLHGWGSARRGVAPGPEGAAAAAEPRRARSGAAGAAAAERLVPPSSSSYFLSSSSSSPLPSLALLSRSAPPPPLPRSLATPLRFARPPLPPPPRPGLSRRGEGTLGRPRAVTAPGEGPACPRPGGGPGSRRRGERSRRCPGVREKRDMRGDGA